MDATVDDDSEWEYEYDDDETEDFYIVLELPNAASQKQKSKADELFAAHDPTKPRKKAAGKKRKKNGAEPNDAADDEAANAPEEGTTSTQPQLVQGLEQLILAAAAASKSSDAMSKGLQIMDFESDEPMIMYQGQMYSCQWASSLGSDVLFMRRPEEPGLDYRPLHSFKEVDILGIGAAKLVASPATIQRRQDYASYADAENGEAPAATGVHSDIVRQAQFIEKIADIKASRGEHIGNLKSLAQSVQQHPEAFGPEKKRKGRGQPKSTPSGRRRPTLQPERSSAGAASAEVTPIIASTRARRASTQSRNAPTPTKVADLDGDEEMADDSLMGAARDLTR